MNLSEIGQQAGASIQLLKDSLGRTDESSGSREALASETFRLYLEGDLVGVGPGRTKATLNGAARTSRRPTTTTSRRSSNGARSEGSDWSHSSR